MPALLFYSNSFVAQSIAHDAGIALGRAFTNAEIRSGKFARDWILENKANAPSFKATRRAERNHPIEEVGRRLRRLMPWIKAKEV